jgi:hypothetical protein
VIEVYAFLAMFAVQILAMSFLLPARLIRYSREQATGVTAEQLSQVYPGVDHELASKLFFTRIRVGSAGVAVIGMLALDWLCSYMRQPEWHVGPVAGVLTVYTLLQYLPILLPVWFTYRFYKTNEHSLSEGKRRAMLERRRLFDFVSPFTVFLAVLAYLLFVASVIYFQREPHPGFFLIGLLTLVYALQAFDVYRALYGKKRGPLDTHTVRAHRTGFAVKFSVYVCILIAVFFAFVFTIDLLDLKRWVPLALSVLFVTVTLLMTGGMTSLLRKSTLSEVPS